MQRGEEEVLTAATVGMGHAERLLTVQGHHHHGRWGEEMSQEQRGGKPKVASVAATTSLGSCTEGCCLPACLPPFWHSLLPAILHHQNALTIRPLTIDFLLTLVVPPYLVTRRPTDPLQKESLTLLSLPFSGTNHKMVDRL